MSGHELDQRFQAGFAGMFVVVDDDHAHDLPGQMAGFDGGHSTQLKAAPAFAKGA